MTTAVAAPTRTWAAVATLVPATTFPGRVPPRIARYATSRGGTVLPATPANASGQEAPAQRSSAAQPAAAESGPAAAAIRPARPGPGGAEDPGRRPSHLTIRQLQSTV